MATAALNMELVTFWMPGVVFYPLLTTIAVLWIIHYVQQRSRFVRLGNKMPGLKPLPFIGNAHVALVSPDKVIEKALELSKDFSPVMRAWLGPILVVFLTDPNDVEIILSSQVHIDKSSEYRFFKPWLGDGLLISTGEKWRAHRKMIAPTFHMNILKSFMDVFNSNSRSLVKTLKKEIGTEFDVHDYLSGATVDILLETAMGIPRRKENHAGFDYAMAVMKMCDIVHQRQYKLYLRSDFIFKFTSIASTQKKLLGIIHSLTNKVIKQKKEEFLKNQKCTNKPSYISQMDQKGEEMNSQNYKLNNASNRKNHGLRDDLDDIDENDVGEKRRLAFLDLMIETAQNGSNLSDFEIKEEVDTIMFEGHDTTAAGSSFVLCLLGTHQDIQTKVYDELYDIFGDSDRPATYTDTVEMKYLERVIMETLRLYPPVPVIARKLNEDVKIVTGNYIIPAGATVAIATYKMHRNPELYPNPEVFDPDNFLPERTQNRHYYSYVPFSAGPRSCVGRKYAMLKLKVLLSTILRNYKILSNLTEKDFKLRGDIILKRTDGFRLGIEPRNRVKSAQG